MYELLGCYRKKSIGGKTLLVPEWMNPCAHAGDPSVIEGCVTKVNGKMVPTLPNGLGHDCSAPITGCNEIEAGRIRPKLVWPDYYSVSDLIERCCYDQQPCAIPGPMNLLVTLSGVEICGSCVPAVPVDTVPEFQFYFNRRLQPFQSRFEMKSPDCSWRNWVGNATYNSGDCVCWQTVFYRSLADDNVGKYPHLNPDWWERSAVPGQWRLTFTFDGLWTSFHVSAKLIFVMCNDTAYEFYFVNAIVNLNDYTPDDAGNIVVQLPNAYASGECCDSYVGEDCVDIIRGGYSGVLVLTINVNTARYTKPQSNLLEWESITRCNGADSFFDTGCGSGQIDLDIYRYYTTHYCNRLWGWIREPLYGQAGRWWFDVGYDPWWLSIEEVLIYYNYSDYRFFTFRANWGIEERYAFGEQIENQIIAANCSSYTVGYGGHVVITGGNVFGNGNIDDWDPDVDYSRMAYVVYDGAVYRSLQNSNQGNRPDISPDWWSNEV